MIMYRSPSAPAAAVTSLHRLVVLLCLSPAGPAAAQSIPSSYRDIDNPQATSILGGYMSLATGSLDLGPKSGTFAGGRYAIEAAGPIFFEGLFAYLPTKRDVIDPRRQLGDRAIGESDVHLLMLDARLSFSLTGRRTWHGFTPHLFAGGGVAHDAAGLSDFDRNLQPEDVFDFGTAFTANAGTGFRLLLGPRFMVRADASLTLWQLSTPLGFDDPEKRPVDEEDPLRLPEQREWVGGYGLTLGLAWRF